MFKSRPYRYNDVRLFLVLIPIIAAINYHLTYVNIRLDWFLLFTFLIDTQQGYVGWLCCRAIIIYLDRVYPYQRNTTKRIVIQTITSSVAGVAAIILQTILVNWIFTDHPMPTSFFTVDVVIIFIWFLVVNGIYIGLHYYTMWQDTEDARLQEKLVRSEGFMVKFGKKNISIPFSEIAGFTIENEYAVLSTTQAKNYYLDESLDMVEQKLPPEFFFRLNRQSIIHRQIVIGFDRGDNGKINVLIRSNEKFPDAIPVSRLKAPAFKTWFQPG
ncbi:MAG: LytTR family DNA-binding domain-containing protein [Chitinophagales bacterium]